MLRKMRKQVKGIFNPWDQKLETGMRIRSLYDGNIYDLYESKGKDKRDAGELSYRKVKKPNEKAIAFIKNGIWYWQW